MLRLASDREACDPLETVPSNSILMAYRGKCFFIDKAWRAAQAGAKGLIVINNSTIGQECVYIGGSGNDSDPAALSSMFVAGATADEGSALLNLIQQEGMPVEATASFALLQIPKMDPAALVLLALAVITIVIAAAWTGKEFKEMLAQQEDLQGGTSQPDSPSRSVPTTFDRGVPLPLFLIPSEWLLPFCCILQTACVPLSCFRRCCRTLHCQTALLHSCAQG